MKFHLLVLLVLLAVFSTKSTLQSKKGVVVTYPYRYYPYTYGYSPLRYYSPVYSYYPRYYYRFNKNRKNQEQQNIIENEEMQREIDQARQVLNSKFDKDT